MKSEIEKALKKYLEAYYRQDFDTMLSLLYEDDVIEYHNTFINFAEKMEPFGENEEFLRRLKVKDIQTLREMSVRDFMISIFQMVSKEIGEKDLKEMIEGVKITHIDDTELMSIVKYEIPYKIMGEWDSFESEVIMIFSDGSWKIFFKSGLNQALHAYEKEIDFYYERKDSDQPEKLTPDGELVPYTVSGYKNAEGDVVIEARFKDAGNFSEGLAYVKIIEKYGYINQQGDLVIKPRFYNARDFSQERAAVQLNIDSQGRKWGFIDPEGQMVIPPKYEEVSMFSEGLCAVSMADEEGDIKWGYIDLKGKTIIPHSFYSAEDFSDGIAFVELLREDGEFTEMTLDTEGNIID